jgi:transcriptional regulator with PAS, ATPase and Fis domain
VRRATLFITLFAVAVVLATAVSAWVAGRRVAGALGRHSLPGIVRELEYALERALILVGSVR